MASRNLRRATITSDPTAGPPERGTPFRLAFEHAPIGAVLLEWDDGFRLVAANRAWCDTLGYTEEELLATDWQLVTHPDERAGEAARTQELLSGTLDRYRLEKLCVRKDGTAFVAAVHIAAGRDGAGNLTHAVAFLDDIGARDRDQQRLRAATAASSDAFMFLDAVRDEAGVIADFVVEYVNAGAVRAVGLTSDVVAGQSYRQVVFPELREQLFRELCNVVERQEPKEGEFPLDYLGDQVWIHFQIVPIGESVAFTARDDTRRHEAVASLRANEERLAAIVEHAHDAIVLTDRRRVVRWVSPAITAIAGYAPEALAGTAWGALVHPGDRVAYDAHVQFTDEHHNSPHRVELRIRHADGHWIWAEEVATNLDDHPAVNGLVAHVRDITASKRAEEALRTSEERFRSLVQNSSDLISVYDEQLQAVYLSPSHRTVLGHDPDGLTTDVLASLAHPDDVERFGQAIRLVAAEPGRTAACQLRLRHADGSWRQLEAKCSNLLHEPAVRGIVVNARDITEAAEALEALRDREEWFRSIVQHSWDLVAVVDADGNFVYLSPSHTVVLGRSIEELLVDSLSLVHPDDRAHVLETFFAVRAEPRSHRQIQYRLQHGDGTWRTFEVTHTNLLDDPAVRGIVINSHDVTEAHAAWMAMRESEERFAALVRYSSDVVLVSRRDGNIHYVSPAIAYVLGYREDEFGEATLASYVHPDDRAAWETHVDEVLEHPAREHTLELRLRHADGRWRWMEAHAVNLLDDDAVRGVVVHLHDISERRVAESELEHQALHDPLTGLPNRALVLDRLGRALARAHRSGMRTVVLFIDVDRFKVVNDSLGHAYGDDLLVAVAARLRASLRETDTVARLGGDEFVVLLEDLSHDTVALDVAEKILDAMRRPFALAGREFFVTASIGLAMSTHEHDTPESMIRDADAAMYVAKGRGRNRLEVFDETIRFRVVRHLEMESDLHRALERGELRLVYQPAYALQTGRITGVEALMRWDHPRRGLVLPGEFIGVAEETGLIMDIGQWTIDEACRQARAWRDEGSSLRTVWVNLSARQLASAALPSVVHGALERHSLPPGAIGLELTESALIEEAEAAGSVLRELADLGVRLAIDDFGTGYSSLLYLQRYHVDVLKVDRSFVSGLGTNDDDTAIASAVISLAHNLGMEVSAEGVETRMQLDRLKDLQCDTACGYYLVRPTTPETITELLRASGSTN